MSEDYGEYGYDDGGAAEQWGNNGLTDGEAPMIPGSNVKGPAMAGFSGDEDEDTTRSLSALAAMTAPGDASEINVKSFEELILDPNVIEASQTAWGVYCRQAGSREAAGEAIYSALFEGAPSLQNLFKTPRAIQAMRFMNGLNNFIGALSEPSQLKVSVEALGFGHLNLDVTVPRVVIFRDAILDLFEVELGEKFNTGARQGWKALLNYVGGAIIFVKTHYASRLKILSSSWELCNKADKDGGMSSDKEGSYEEGTKEGEEGEETKKSDSLVQNIPTNFKDMFKFNAAVMGFGQSAWMNEVLECFDGIVTNVADSNRMQQECDVLLLRIAVNETQTKVKLSEFKSCMLAALRSLLPSTWDTEHEVAWAWLWENTERLLQKTMGKPQKWGKSLDTLLTLFDDSQLYEFRKSIFSRFFVACPAGQDFFKQSDTRLHFIIDNVIKMVIDIFHEPIRMCDDISALGLRHVGYGVPTDMFGPFVTAAIEVLKSFTQDTVMVEAFEWSLGLVANLLVRTITEGSTIVMTAITSNNTKMFKKAVSCAPRGERAKWVLLVQVGTQNISPLLWAIDTGALLVAKAILDDLLTIRADRQRYYYGVDDVFFRHPDIIHRLVTDAPTLLPSFLDGLVWRSSNASKGKRRVNFYIKHLVQTPSRGFAPTLNWLVESRDPKIIAHPVVVFVSDTLWAGLVCREFMKSRVWFVASLLVFMLSQAILPRMDEREQQSVRIVIFAGRCFTYVLTMLRLFVDIFKDIYHDCKQRRLVKSWFVCRLRILPQSLSDPSTFAGFLLMWLLALIAAHEPCFWCLTEPDFPQITCEASEPLQFRYSALTMCAMVIHWFLLVDLAVFNTALSAFLLVVGQVLSEMGRFMTAFVFLLFTFGTAVSVLDHDYIEMQDVGSAVLALFAITLQVYEDDYRTMRDSPALLVAVLIFVLASAVLLLNLLVAQLGCSYEFIYQDSVGFARLKRAQVICETIEVASHKRWTTFLDTLKLDDPIEFNEGDVGLSGGIQLLEDASLHPSTTDSIYRFGGSCSPDIVWPETNETMGNETDDRFDRMEASIQKALKRFGKSSKSGGESGTRSDSDGEAASQQGSDQMDSGEQKGSSDHDFAGFKAPERTGGGFERQSSVGLPGAPGPEIIFEAEEEDTTDTSMALVDKINEKSFDELTLDPKWIGDAQRAWQTFIQQMGTKEHAGEAVYQALVDSSPQLQAMFTTPRAVQAMRFMNGLNGFVMALDDPKKLKMEVETLGFGHLNIDVTIPRVEVFRDAILDLLRLELGARLTRHSILAWKMLLNYIGGAIIYIKANYSERLAILSESWELCNQTVEEHIDELEEDMQEIEKADKHKKDNSIVQNVPTDFKGMFQFNAAVMGFGSNSIWMNEVLASFGDIVTHVANAARLQVECDLLSIKLTKTTTGSINLAEYKSCMLAALRSLLPKIWSTNHEVAWAWLWENVERLLKATLGSPPKWEKALDKLIESLDDSAQFEIRKEIYAQFFSTTPAGQDFFKQSDTRLHFIADRVIQMTREIFHDPWSMADEISALGLRHVGYDIPTELFGPFVSACISVMETRSNETIAVESFRWSLNLISKLLVRTIHEGSTIVMKAINSNNRKALGKALACAPRGERASWCLVVEVGTQSISPFMWSITSGSFAASEAIIEDLLTIRADREKYYYGVEELFTRHPDIIQRIVADAPILLPPLLDGLVWRSRNTVDGMRRVNYYVKHLVCTHEGGVSQTLDWIAAAKDPKIISHPVIVLVSDTLWSGIVSRQFVNSKIWFVMSLVVMMMSQAIMPKLDLEEYMYMRVLVFVGRCQVYLLTMCRMFVRHAAKIVHAYKTKQIIEVMPYVKIPSYLTTWIDGSGFCLVIFFILMAVHEPFLWCIGDENWPTEKCPEVSDLSVRYAVFCCLAMGLHWALLVDFSVFNTGLSAFVLVVAQVMSEIIRFVIALVFLLLTFGSAISALQHEYDDMRDIPGTMLALFAIVVRLYEHDYRNLRPDPALLTAVFVFVTATSILLLNLLTAQLNCSYEFIYQASVGFARLNRAETIVETLKTCPQAKWHKFVKSLRFDQPLEFNEGDVGLPGGLQVQEPAFLNPVTHDRILRFGGSCAPEMPFPTDDTTMQADTEEDRFTRMENLITKAMKRLSKSTSSKRRTTQGRTSGLDMSGMSGMDSAMSGMGDSYEEDAYSDAGSFGEDL